MSAPVLMHCVADAHQVAQCHASSGLMLLLVLTLVFTLGTFAYGYLILARLERSSDS